MQILIGIAIGCVLVGLGFFVWTWFVTWLDDRTAAAVESFFEEHKTHQPEVENNPLAKEPEIIDNPRVIPEASDSEPPLPFWNDKDKIIAARNRIEGSTHNDPESEEALANLSPYEQWQKLDQRALDLEDVNPELNAGQQPSIS